MSLSGLRRALARAAPAVACALALALASQAARAAAPDAACAVPVALVERFIPADCEACWRSGDAPAGAALVLDWIVPGARGDDAALAAAAIAEAAPRAGRLDPVRTLVRRHALAAGHGPAVIVEQGPPWQGYIAAQVHAVREPGTRPARDTDGRGARTAAYLALVEQVRAGEEGTPVERMLVRAVVGPLPLDAPDAVVTHLHAFRIPQGSKPARLAAVGWVESAGGKVLAAARVEPDGCPPAR